MRILQAFGAMCLSLLGAACPFHYTPAIQHDIVFPIVLMKLQSIETTRFYSINRPTIEQKGNSVDLLIGAYNEVNGSTLLDASFIEIRLNACTKKILDSDWVTSNVVDAPKH
jgi:hypothetical protein